MKKTRPWTQGERDYLESKYGTMTAAQLAFILDRSTFAVYRMARKMKLKSNLRRYWNAGRE